MIDFPHNMPWSIQSCVSSWHSLLSLYGEHSEYCINISCFHYWVQYSFNPLSFSVSLYSIADRLALRQKLNCNSFRWYLENVYPELKIPEQDAVYSLLKQGGLCLESQGTDALGLEECKSTPSIPASQKWTLIEPQIRQHDLCLAITAFTAGSKVRLEPCNIKESRQKWKPRGPALQHMISGLCLDSQPPSGPPLVTQCRPQVSSQSWEPQLVTWLWQLQGGRGKGRSQVRSLSSRCCRSQRKTSAHCFSWRCCSQTNRTWPCPKHLTPYPYRGIAGEGEVTSCLPNQSLNTFPRPWSSHGMVLSVDRSALLNDVLRTQKTRYVDKCLSDP